MRRIPNFIAGVATAGGGAISDVFDPNTGEVQAKVPHADQALLERASHDAAAAQPAWAAVNPQRRARVMFRFKELIEQHMAELAQLLSSEHNETLSDARGDIQRGLEVVECVCGVPHLQKGEHTEDAGPGIDTWSMRQPRLRGPSSALAAAAACGAEHEGAFSRQRRASRRGVRLRRDRLCCRRGP